jgi:hypothetical protein
LYQSTAESHPWVALSWFEGNQTKGLRAARTRAI